MDHELVYGRRRGWLYLGGAGQTAAGWSVGFYGYGDEDPKVVVLLDSITIMKGPQGYIDTTSLVQQVVAATIGPTFVLSYAEARVLRDDYARMAELTAILGAVSSLVCYLRERCIQESCLRTGSS